MVAIKQSCEECQSKFRSGLLPLWPTHPMLWTSAEVAAPRANLPLHQCRPGCHRGLHFEGYRWRNGRQRAPRTRGKTNELKKNNSKSEVEHCRKLNGSTPLQWRWLLIRIIIDLISLKLPQILSISIAFGKLELHRAATRWALYSRLALDLQRKLAGNKPVVRALFCLAFPCGAALSWREFMVRFFSASSTSEGSNDVTG